MSANSSVLEKNTGDRVQLKKLIIRLVKYNVLTSLIYKYYRKEKLGDFRGQILKEVK